MLSEEDNKVIQKLIDGAVKLLNHIKMDVDYGLISLEWMERFIDNERNNYSEEIKRHIMATFGAYYGECIRLTYDGRWVKTDYGWAIELTHKNGSVVVSCFGKVEKWMQSGETGDSFVAMFKAIPRLLEQFIEPSDN